jgi:hypothetical protein
LAQVWIIEKKENERNSQKEIRDGAGVGRIVGVGGGGEQHHEVFIYLTLSFA